MHFMLHRPCAVAALALFGLAVLSPAGHAQSSSLSAVAAPDDFRTLQLGQWYVNSQLLVATAASATHQQTSTLSTLPSGPGEPVSPLGPLATSATLGESSGTVSVQVTSDFLRMGSQVTNPQDAAVGGPSVGVSFSVTTYSFYSSGPGPVTFTAALKGLLSSAQAGDAFGMVFLANGLAPSTQGLEAVADSVGIDLDLAELALVQNIRDVAPTFDVRTADVTLRKDSGLPGGVNVLDTNFSLVSQGKLVDCGGLAILPICGSYQHLFALGMLVAAGNDASAQYGLSVTSVQAPTAPVPEPTTVALTLSGLAALATWRRRPASGSVKA